MDNCTLMYAPTHKETFSHLAQPKLLKWQHPWVGFVAVNCDGSFRNSDGRCGYGIIIRDGHGMLVMAKSSCFPKTELVSKTQEVEYGVIVLMIEMLAIRDALRLAKNLGLSHVQIQSDSKIAISILVGHAKCPVDCLGVFFDIQREIPFFVGLGFVFVYRECNRAADFLSKLLTAQGEKCLDSSELPHQLQNIIIEDGLGVLTARF